MVFDYDVSQNAGSSADHHMAADRWMPFSGPRAYPAQGHTLIDEHIVAQFAGLADYNTHSVIYEQPLANDCTRMDLYAC